MKKLDWTDWDEVMLEIALIEKKTGTPEFFKDVVDGGLPKNKGWIYTNNELSDHIGRVLEMEKELIENVTVTVKKGEKILFEGCFKNYELSHQRELETIYGRLNDYSFGQAVGLNPIAGSERVIISLSGQIKNNLKIKVDDKKNKMPDYWEIQKKLEDAWEAVAHSAVYDSPVTERTLERARKKIEASKDDEGFRYDLYSEAFENLKQAWEFVKVGDALPLQVIIGMVNQAAHDILSLRIFLTLPMEKLYPLKMR